MVKGLETLTLFAKGISNITNATADLVQGVNDAGVVLENLYNRIPKRVRDLLAPVERESRFEFQSFPGVRALVTLARVTSAQADAIRADERSLHDATVGAERWSDVQGDVAEETETATAATKDFSAEIGKLRGTLPSVSELLLLNPAELRTLRRDVEAELRDIDPKLRLSTDLPAFADGLEQAMRRASSEFVTGLERGVEAGMTRAIRGVFDGDTSIFEAFQKAARGVSDGISGGITGELSREASDFANRGLRRSFNDLSKAFGSQISGLRQSLTSLVGGGDATVGQQRLQTGAQVLGGGLAVAGGIQQGGVGGFVTGALGGASAGATIGSFFGPTGTVVGAIAGGIIGGVASLFGGGSKERLRVEAAAFTTAEALTADFASGIGDGFLTATEKGIGDFNASDAEVLAGFAIQDYLRGIRSSLEALPGQIRDQALASLDNFQFDAGTLFGEGGSETLQSFRSFLEGGLGGRLSQQLAPVFVGVFESLGASAERAEQFVAARFGAIAGSHSQEVAKQLEDRFRRDFAALTDIANLAAGNTGLAGGIDRVRFILRDLGVEVSGLSFDAVIEKARELVSSLEIDEDVANKIREATSLLVDIPVRISGAIRATASRIRSLATIVGKDFGERIGTAITGSIDSINQLLANTELSIEQRASLSATQQGNIQELIELERSRYEQAKQEELDRFNLQSEAQDAQIEGLQEQISLSERLRDGFQGVVDNISQALLGLRTGTDSVLSPAERLGAIRSEITGLQARATTAEGSELIDIQQRLTNLFPEAVRIAREGFGEGSAVAFAEFSRAEEGLITVQEQARDLLLTEQGLLARQGEILQSLQEQQASLLGSIEEVNNRQFMVSETTQHIIDAHLENQVELLSQQETLQNNMVSEMQQSNRFLRVISETLQRIDRDAGGLVAQPI